MFSGETKRFTIELSYYSENNLIHPVILKIIVCTVGHVTCVLNEAGKNGALPLSPFSNRYHFRMCADNILKL